MASKKFRSSQSKPIWFVLLILLSLGLLVATLLQGHNVLLLSPKGLIASQERKLLFLAVALLLEIAIPALSLFYFTAWKYREANENAIHDSKSTTSKSIVFSIWAFPFITMALLSSVMWPAAHKLAPQKSISSSVAPLKVQVIALRWKWLFIYPEQQIATVNFMQIPVNRPVQFDISADEAPMSSFWIPQLGGQIYAMTGHVNRLNLQADTPGDYSGRSAEINGAGFAGMIFTTRASSVDSFNEWVRTVKQSPLILDGTEYQKLLAPSEYNHVQLYAQAGSDIYDTMIAKYLSSHGQHTEQK